MTSSLALLAVAAVATAQARRDARLSYERKPGTEACQDEGALRDAVAVRLGYDPFIANRGPLVHVIVRQADKGYRATIALKDENDEVRGTREVSSKNADCVELSSVVALTISMAIDPLAQPGAAPSAPPAPTPTPTPSAPQTPTAAPPPPASQSPAPAPAPNPPPTPTSTLAMYAGPGLSFGGAAPGAAAALLAGVELTEGPTSLALEGRVQSASSSDATANGIAPAGTTISASLLGGSLVGCLHYRGFGGCVVPVLGSLRGSATLPLALDQSTLFAALGLRATYDREVTKVLWLSLFVEGLATLTPTTFLFQKGTAWESGPLGGTLGARLLVRFP